MDDVQLTRWLREATSLADVLRRLRDAQQLTVREVAEYANLAPSYVSMLERGIKHPRRDTLVALLLAGFSLPVSQADRILLFAGFAPMHYHRLATGTSLLSAAESNQPSRESSSRELR